MYRFLLMYLFMALNLSAAEYFVSTVGSDSAAGSRENPFRTITKGGRTLKPGDTLTIGPGEYFESVELSFKGDPARLTVVRAEIPGSVLIRGDKPVSGFTKVDGFRFIYELDWTENVNAVNERDTLKIYLPAGSMRELEFYRSRWFYDHDRKKLYISTSDGEPPAKHELTISVLNGNGFLMTGAINVLLDGISATGFYSHEKVENSFSQSRHGIYLLTPRNSIIRNCTAFLNSNGIILGSGQSENSVIENCTAYANGSHQPSSGGNIIGWGPCKNNTIRNCLSFYSNVPGSQPQGIRFYAGNLENCLIENCISFGEDMIYIKGTNRNSWVKNTFAERGMAAANSANNAYFRGNAYNSADPDSLKLERLKSQVDQLFADPENHDYRPQAGAGGIEKGLIDKKDVYFIALNGDDNQDGRSLKTAWRTLNRVKPGSTVYLLPGTYPNVRLNASDVTIKTRGRGERAVVTDGEFTGNNLTIRDINFQGPVTAKGDDIKITCCRFAGKLAVTGKQFQLTHNDFKVDPDLAQATGYRHSNTGIGNAPGPVSLDNGVSFDALPLGPYQLVRDSQPVRLTGPFVRSATATTANIEWWTDTGSVTSELAWGEDKSCRNKVGQPFTGSFYHTVTLTGLTPGKKYYFKINSRMPPREYHANVELEKADRELQRTMVTSPVQEFATIAADQKPATYHVGSDHQYQTISDALDQVKAGDTVIVHAGSYTESVFFRAGGDLGKPVTLQAAPGEKVFLDGKGIISSGMVIANKSHLVIDGFHIRNIRGTSDGGIKIEGGGHILIQRCFYDGRSFGYTPGIIRADLVTDLTLANCVIIRGFHGAVINHCPNLIVRNNVWYLNQIDHLHVFNNAEETLTVTRNIFFDTIPMKYRNPLIGGWHLEALRESNNCYYLRLPESVRKITGARRIKGQSKTVDFTYPEFLEATGSPHSSIFVNPEIPALPEIAAFKDLTNADQKWGAMNRDQLPLELKQTKQGYAPLDFKDFISANPECRQKNIGLEPKLFNLPEKQ